jgi:hypothetical protein
VRGARQVVVRDDGLHQALVLLQAQQAAAQQTLDVALLCLNFPSFTADWKPAYEGSACPTGLVEGESPVGVVDGDRVAILEPV